MKAQLLAINLGSSSLKFALYLIKDSTNLTRACLGRLSGIGARQGELSLLVNDDRRTQSVSAPNYVAAFTILRRWLEDNVDESHLLAIGHRLVHGGTRYQESQRLSVEVVDALASLRNLDPKHLPGEIFFARAFMQEFPHLHHLACFDTQFHKSLPRVAQLFAIPRRYFAQGIRRYGFHGLSCEYVMNMLAEREAGVRGRVIIAHLGSGASLTAVLDGHSVETTMGLTPASGVPMSSRAGDLDPGLLTHLALNEQLTPLELQQLINQESGLLGVSETSGDLSELLKQEQRDPRAADAIQLFCYHVRKSICGLTGVLEGLDTLVFCGGVGENLSDIRARICAGLEFLGVEIADEQNTHNDAIISTPASRVSVRVIQTNEELIIAQHCIKLLNNIHESGCDVTLRH